MHASLQSLLQAVDADKARLDGARPLPLHALQSLREKLTLEWTYNSNAIEGNTLTLPETKVVLGGVAVGNKLLREHWEATNHRDAILSVEEIVANNEALSESQIQHLHRFLMKGIDEQGGGRYRDEHAAPTGTRAAAPESPQVSAEMAGLIDWHAQAAALHPVARAAELHARFVRIHPFVEGNGQTARLLLNLDLMKAGYPPAVIRQEDRAAYGHALDDACGTGNFTAVAQLVAEATQRTLATYLNLLGAGD